jgi:hypothetical protein
MSANQNIADTTVTKVAFDTEEKDTLGGVDTANNQFVVQNSGDYAVVVRLQMDDAFTSADILQVRVFVNGSQETNDGNYIPSSSTLNAFAKTFVTFDRELNANDSIDIRVEQRSGNQETISSGFARFGIIKLG